VTADTSPTRADARRIGTTKAGAAARVIARGLERSRAIQDASPEMIGAAISALVLSAALAVAHAEPAATDLYALVAQTKKLAPFLVTRVELVMSADEAEVDVAAVLTALDVIGPRDLGAIHEELLGLTATAKRGELVLGFTEERRRAGAHYTSPQLARVLVARALAPLLDRASDLAELLSLRVCDAAVGSGAFLLEVTEQLAARAVDLGAPDARPAIVTQVVYGVDRDPIAVGLARDALALLARRDASAPLEAHLVVGDALTGAGAIGDDEGLPGGVSWPRAFPEVLARGGFDLMIGNPPWVSYAGRASQPLSPALRARYLQKFASFSGFRNLQTLFVERAAKLLAPGGRLAQVLPTSMSDLGGYASARRVHDLLCEPDEELPDFGEEAFEGVFQPCMGLLSTRRAGPLELVEDRPWPLARNDLSAATRATLARLEARPTLPDRLFGERGFQSSGDDAHRLSRTPEGARKLPLRVGGDVAPFARGKARLFCDPEELGGRLRTAEAFREVRLLIRQTARYPMAALSDGLPFRNSVLAGFEDAEHPAGLMLAYLGSSPVRWLHYVRYRDARQGMPQVKIGHLRSLPDLDLHAAEARELHALGDRIGAANEGISAEDQARIDALVATVLELDDATREEVAAWARAHGPKTDA
jgi:hypothetical protein